MGRNQKQTRRDQHDTRAPNQVGPMAYDRRSDRENDAHSDEFSSGTPSPCGLSVFFPAADCLPNHSIARRALYRNSGRTARGSAMAS